MDDSEAAKFCHDISVVPLVVASIAKMSPM